MGKKNVGKKAKKTFFYIQTNIVTNKRGGNARKKFSETHEECDQKCLEKNRRKKGRKSFLFSHEYHYKKMRGKKRSKQFFQKHTNSASK